MPIECKVTTISTWLAPITVVETARGVRFVDLDDGARQFRREAAGEYIRVPGEPESYTSFPYRSTFAARRFNCAAGKRCAASLTGRPSPMRRRD